MLKLGQIGMAFVGHHLHHTAGALRGHGRAESLVHIQGNCKKAVVAVVGQIHQRYGRGVFGAFFPFFILL